MLYLTHRIFTERDAGWLWVEVVVHRGRLIAFWGRNPDIVVSCLDYMSNVEHLLKEPKIIEK